MTQLTPFDDTTLDQDYEQLQLDRDVERILNEGELIEQEQQADQAEPVADDVMATEQEAPEAEPLPDDIPPANIRRVDEFKTKQTYLEQIPAAIPQIINSAFDFADDVEQTLTGKEPVRIQFLDENNKFIRPRVVSESKANELMEGGVADFTRSPEFEKADSTSKQMVRDVATFLGAFLLTRRALPPAQKGQRLGNAVKDMFAGGSAATVVVDPEQDGLAELLNKVPVVGEAFEPLLNDENDSPLVKRLKNGLEDAGASALFDTLTTMVRAGSKALVKDRVPEAVKEIEELAIPGLGDASQDMPVFGLADEFKIGGEATTPEELIGKGFVQVESGGDDIYVNFARIESPDEVKGLIDQMAQKESAAIKKAQRGKVSFEEIEALADDMGVSVDALKNRNAGEGFLNAETAVASRKLLASSAENLLTLSKQASKADATPQQLYAFRRAVSMHKAVQSEVLGAQAETARALASFKIPVDGKANVDIINAALEQSGGTRLAQDLAKKMAKLEELGISSAGINSAVQKGALAKTSDAISEAYVTGLLWTPSTHIVNFVGNTMSMGFDTANRRMAQAINTFTGNKGGVAQGEALASIHGLKNGFREALIHASRTARGIDSSIGGVDRTAVESGSAQRAISSEALGVSLGPLATAVDMLGSTIRAPGIVLTATDEFFKSVGYRMQVHALAYRTAANEGLEASGEAFAKRVDELVKNPSKEIQMQATDATLYNTFQNKTGEIGEIIVKARGAAGPVGTWFLPFARTPVNLFRYTLENSPAAPVVRQWREDFSAGGARKQMALAKMTLGTMYAGVAMDMAQAGYIFGSGPDFSDRGERESMRRQGMKANSFVVGDKAYPFTRFDPIISTTFSVAADLYDLSERYDWPEDNEMTGVVQSFGVALGRAVTNKTYLKSVADITDALTDESGRALERVAGQIAAASIPMSTAVSTVERMMDPALRETMGILDDIKSRIPGLSKTLIPRRNLWGEVRQEAGGGAAPFLPVNPSDLTDSVVDREIFRHNVPTSEIRWRGVPFDGVRVDFSKYPKVLDEYRKLAGNEAKDLSGLGLKEKLQAVIEGKHFEGELYNFRSDGMDGEKSQYIQKQITEFRKRAQKEILNSDKYDDNEEFLRFKQYLAEEKARKPAKFNFQ